MSGQLATDANRASSSDSPRIAPAALAAFVKRALEAAGLSSEDAEIVAGLMVEADLRGSDTHGVIRLPLYLRRLKAGGIKARADIARAPRSSMATTPWAISSCALPP
jgi:LDH2 family malate/lactate/ureidoglycolate dehydrogenase